MGPGHTDPRLTPKAVQHATVLREVRRLARLLGDTIHDTDPDQHPTLLKAIETGLIAGGKPVISGATVTIDYPQQGD